MLQPWPDVERERLASFRVFDVDRVRRTSPRTGKDLDFYIIETFDWVNVVALTDAQEIVLVRQFRHGTGRFTLEAPGGVIDEGEAPEEAAARELREESGFEACELRRLGIVNPNPAIFSNNCTTYLATGCHRVSGVSPDPGEDLEVVTLDRAGLKRAVLAGEVNHALVLAAFAWLEFSDEPHTLIPDAPNASKD